jgi:hypothetical protein
VELVRLVDENEVNRRPLASRERLYRTHLDRRVAIGALVDALHDADAMNALGFECLDGLVDKAQRGDHEGDPLVLVEGALDHMRRQQGLSEAGCALKNRTALAARQRGAEGVQSAFLMWA